MAQELPIAYDEPQHDYAVQLEGVQYQIRLTWRELRPGWYLDLYEADGTAIAEGLRVSPGIQLNAGLTNGPPGVIAAVGEDSYARTEIKLFYVPSTELPVAADTRTYTVLLT